MSSIASARNAGSELLTAASEGWASSTVGASSAIVSLRFADSSASAPAKTLKLVISSWSWDSWPSSLLEDGALRLDQAGEVVLVDAEQRLVDDRDVAPGVAAVAKRLVERLGGCLALHVGVLGRCRRPPSARR